MNISFPRGVGLLTIIIGVDIFIGFLLYGLSFRAFDRMPLLTISAFLITIGALLNIMLVWIFHPYVRARSPWFSQLVLITGTTGSLIVFIGAAFDFLDTIVGHALIILFPLSQTRSIIVVGYAFIGIWLLLLNYHARVHDTWSPGLTWLGIIAGTIMTLGLLAAPRVFIPYVSLYHRPVPEIAEIVGDLGWKFLYPFWSIWTGYVFLNGRHSDQHLEGFARRFR